MFRSTLWQRTATNVKGGSIPMCIPLSQPQVKSHLSLLGLHNHSPQECAEAIDTGALVTVACVKEAYRERCKELHPDVTGGASEAQFRDVLVAYEALMEEHTRNTQLYGEGNVYPVSEREAAEFAELSNNDKERDNHCDGFNPFYQEEPEEEEDCEAEGSSQQRGEGDSVNEREGNQINSSSSSRYQDNGSFRSFTAGFQHQNRSFGAGGSSNNRSGVGGQIQAEESFAQREGSANPAGAQEAFNERGDENHQRQQQRPTSSRTDEEENTRDDKEKSSATLEGSTWAQKASAAVGCAIVAGSVVWSSFQFSFASSPSSPRQRQRD